MSDLAAVHARLRAIMLAATGARHVVAIDAPGDLIVRTTTPDARGEPGWFGMVRTGKRAVAYHLMSLYDRPELAADLSPALTKRRQGKTCFNFTRVDEALFVELAALTREAA